MGGGFYRRFLLMMYAINDNHITLLVKITPNAAERAVKGVVTSADGTEYLRINIISIPEKGKANKELIKFLSKELDIAKSDIEIVSGESNHLKRLKINSTSQHIINKLQQWSRA